MAKDKVKSKKSKEGKIKVADDAKKLKKGKKDKASGSDNDAVKALKAKIKEGKNFSPMDRKLAKEHGIELPKPGTAAKGKGKAKAKKNPLPTWKAPADFTSSFPVEVTFKTEKDGMPGSRIKAVRYKGRYDPKADDNKKFNFAEYDPDTLRAIAVRLALTQFHATGKPSSKGVPSRLAPSSTYRIILRVGKKKADNTLTARITTVLQAQEKGAKVKLVELDKKDPDVRRIKKAQRYLAAAFAAVKPLPSRPKRSKHKDADEDDE